MNNTTTGTNCFPSFRDACIHYQPYCNSYDEAVELVRAKLDNEEIQLSKPQVKNGETAFVKENRWHIRK